MIDLGFVDQIKEIYTLIVGLPGSVWALALFIFIAIMIGKAAGVVRADGWAASANLVLSIVAGGGFASLTELSAALETSAVSVIAAVYYIIWDRALVPKVWPWLKDLFKKK